MHAHGLELVKTVKMSSGDRNEFRDFADAFLLAWKYIFFLRERALKCVHGKLAYMVNGVPSAWYAKQCKNYTLTGALPERQTHAVHFNHISVAVNCHGASTELVEAASFLKGDL